MLYQKLVGAGLVLVMVMAIVSFLYQNNQKQSMLLEDESVIEPFTPPVLTPDVIAGPRPTGNPPSDDFDSTSASCYVGGCSSQICSDNPEVMTTCEYREEYACYRSAVCERQPSGQCGWTETPDLLQCIAIAMQAETNIGEILEVR